MCLDGGKKGGKMVYNWEIYFPPHVRIALNLLVVQFYRIQLTKSQNGFQCVGDSYPVNAWNIEKRKKKQNQTMNVSQAKQIFN